MGNNMLEIQKFLNDHQSDWKSLLTADPYNLFIREKDDMVLFMYNQIDSDFNIPLVSECRGIIFQRDTWKVIACAFYKFWNSGQGHAATIDWSTARVLTKEDGSIQKLFWHNGEWRVSTMSMIDAHECTLQNDLNDSVYNTFYDLFTEAAKIVKLDFDKLNKGYTYTFELCTPWNRVIVPHKEFKLIHITTRDNETLQELELDIGVPKPKAYSMASLDEVVAMAQTLPFSEEGYVVVDGNYNRIKIKSPAYLAVHHLHNNGDINKRRALELIMINEQDEFLSYFPEYIEFFDKIKVAFDDYLDKIRKDVQDITSCTFETKKDYAMVAKNMTSPTIMFLLYDKKVTVDTWEAHVRGLQSEKVIDYLGIYN